VLGEEEVDSRSPVGTGISLGVLRESGSTEELDDGVVVVVDAVDNAVGSELIERGFQRELNGLVSQAASPQGRVDNHPEFDHGLGRVPVSLDGDGADGLAVVLDDEIEA
jgi:hypothetical protein